METTLTQAGLLAHAGAARLVCGALAPSSALVPAAAPAAALVATTGVYGTQPASTWTKGAIAENTAAMVFNRKHRPSRQPSELSP